MEQIDDKRRQWDLQGVEYRIPGALLLTENN